MGCELRPPCSTYRQERLQETCASIGAPTARPMYVHSHWHCAVRAGWGLASMPCGATLCGHWGSPWR
eukprot:2216160-Prorocentrum_lima.AAC.1